MSSTPSPIVLVSADQRELDGFTWHASIDTYLKALAGPAAVSPLIVPAFAEAIVNADVLAAASGVLVTGSRTNVHPKHYAAAPTQAHEPFDLARDSTTLPLIRAAIERRLPLLAICRGHQELNVALGGTLDTEIQTFEGRQDHRGGPSDARQDERFALNHTVTVTPGGRLETILGRRELHVNSVHRQAIGVLADELQVEAQAEDGTIEAISVRDTNAFTLGLQWHPEYWASQPGDTDPASTSIFKAFGEAVRAYRG